MAADLIGRYTDTQDPDFRHRVLVALVEAAIANVGEAVGTVASDKRAAFARAVISNPSSQLDQACLLVVADGTGGASTDAVIRARCGGLWNAFAGVRGGE